MRTVERNGDRYLLLKRSGDSSLVRDPETDIEQYFPNEELTVTGDSPLHTVARTVAEPQRRLVTAVHSEQLLGLLVELDDHGPRVAREILELCDLCESDLHGQLMELRAAGLVREIDVSGERGYEATELASDGLSALR